MSMRFPEQPVRWLQSEDCLGASTLECGHLRGQDSMVRRETQIDTPPLEPNHVSLVLLAHVLKCRLILEFSKAGDRGEALASGDVWPGLPAFVRKDIGGIVVAAVAFAHEKADQSRIRVLHDFLAPTEADARGVDDREVVSHRIVETDEPMIEDGNSALRYHTLRDPH